MIVSNCAKHNQYAKHANARGPGGMPSRKIFKNSSSEIEFGDVLESIYKQVHIKFESN